MEFIEGISSKCPNIDNLLDKIQNKEYIYDHVISCIRKCSNNDEIVKFRVYGDLEEYFRLKLSDEATITLTYQFIEQADINDIHELRFRARRNSEKTTEIIPMSDILEMFKEDNPYRKGSMFVARCNNGVNGASAMLQAEKLNELAEKCEVDELTILPSSIHEVIIWTGPIDDEDEANKMINDINDNVVEDIEILSDHVYKYFY